MFRFLETFFSTLVEHEGQSPAVSKLQLATAAVLTRAATVHIEMSQARRAKRHAVLGSHFDLDDRPPPCVALPAGIASRHSYQDFAAAVATKCS
jgi:uncharacterized tellurite resistance protein B-like protein